MAAGEIKSTVVSMGDLLTSGSVNEWVAAKGLNAFELVQVRDDFVESAKQAIAAGRRTHEQSLEVIFLVGLQIGMTLMERRGP